MIQLTHHTRILLGVAPADVRSGIDGFLANYLVLMIIRMGGGILLNSLNSIPWWS